MDVGEVDGYPAHPSVRAGDTLRLHVSTAVARFRVDFFRWGRPVRRMGGVEWRGEYAPRGRHDEDWRWPAYDFQVPQDWPSGVYIVLLTTGPLMREAFSPNFRVLDGQRARALVVVTPSRPPNSGVLYKVPVFTYHAYNTSGGGSLYGLLHSETGIGGQGGLAKVTLRRPGGGTGGLVKGLPDAFDPSSPRQTFAHWDAPLITWLEAEGIGCDFCTDLDLHLGRLLGADYRLLLSGGHDEYWSAQTRQAVTAFRSGGGNIANFGANTCWWRVRVNEDAAVLCCEKFPPLASPEGDPDTVRQSPDKWWEFEPENTITGVSYRNGGGCWNGRREPIGYTVQHSAHWAFEGAGLRRGDVIGADQALVGYECDGAHLTYDRLGRALPTGLDGTPDGFEILGVGRLPAAGTAGWQFAAREEESGSRAATMGTYSDGGTVFTAATTDWPRVLQSDQRVQIITRNVISRLTRS